jgi:hypothetical protein
MSKLPSPQQKALLKVMKICLSCFGIAGATVLASGMLQMGIRSQDPSLGHRLDFLCPLNDALNQIVEHLLH